MEIGEGGGGGGSKFSIIAPNTVKWKRVNSEEGDAFSDLMPYGDRAIYQRGPSD